MEIRRGRVLSIDMFRALTIFVMITVNEWHGVKGLPDWMKHMPATADAMTFVDVVFPAFLFIVGMSIPFALQSRLDQTKNIWQTQKHVLQRALGLVVIGVFMVNAEDGSNPAFMQLPIAAWALLTYVAAFLVWGSVSGGAALAWWWRVIGGLLFVVLAWIYHGGADGQSGMTHQWWGILGLIGWAYLIACTVFQLSRGRILWMSLAIVLCMTYFVLSRQAGLMQQPVFAMLLSQDPHFSHATLSIAGCVTSLIFFDENLKKELSTRTLWALLFALVLAIAATLLRPEYKISKIIATPSWVLYCSAICIVIFTGFYYWIEVQQRRFLNAFFEPIAANPLIAYLIPFIFGAVLTLLQLRLPAFVLQGATGVLYGAFFSIAVALLTRQIAKRGIRLRI